MQAVVYLVCPHRDGKGIWGGEDGGGGGSEKQLCSYKRHNNDTLLNKNTRVGDVSI